MTDFDFEGLDRFRERQRWIPAWIDRHDWQTWLWHAAITLTLASLLAWATPIPFAWCGRLFYALYAWREVRNVRQLRREGRPLKPLDHAMDVLTPLVVVELLAWRFA